ncbi:hypothetical protein QJQ45_001262 [Haematococcus lacustris]|nr:hypothetical protein QJQ45_001262 [Haematococcus lacustris]
MVKSRYVVVVENVSSITPRKDVEKECERVAGPVLAAAKDNDRRMALVEFKYSSDAEYAWRKLHNTTMDGRSWKLDWATPSDFKLMGWK